MLTAFHSIVFPHSSSHDVPWCSIPSISKVVDSVALALTIAFFTSTARGCPAETALRLWVSYIHCVTFRQHVQLSTYNPARPPRPISVVTTMGIFSCLVNLVSEPVDAAYDVKLGTLSSWFLNVTFGWYLPCFVVVPISRCAFSPCEGIYLFQTHPSEALKTEMKRLEELNEATRKEWVRRQRLRQ